MIATAPIPNQAPLFRALTDRRKIELHVLFTGRRVGADEPHPTFGVPVEFDEDLLRGYHYRTIGRATGGRGAVGGRVLAFATRAAGKRVPLVIPHRGFSAEVTRWMQEFGLDTVIVHGHADPRMLLSIRAARQSRVPYLLRSEARPEGEARGLIRTGRNSLASWTVRHAWGALAIGLRNRAFYERFGAARVFWCPYAVDNAWFAVRADRGKKHESSRRHALGIALDRPLVIFVGKLQPWKRPVDLVQAVKNLGGLVSLVVVGDGPTRAEAERAASRVDYIRFVGYCGKEDVADYLGCADVLSLPSEVETWGLVVNEAMACGVIPLVSDRVGCAPDLVNGVGEVHPVGDVAAIEHALRLMIAPGELRRRQALVADRIAHYSIEAAAQGIEEAAIAVIEWQDRRSQQLRQR